ncbi:unnamed protein product, partial [Prorocentrum cordatum]
MAAQPPCGPAADPAKARRAAAPSAEEGGIVEGLAGASGAAPKAGGGDQAGAEGCAPVASRAQSCVCLAAVFLARFEVSAIALCIPPVAAEFGVSLELAAWVHLAGNFAATMTGPPVAKLADMHGRERVWHASFLLLTCSTWLAALAPSLPALLVARAATGAAHSGIFAPSLALLAQGLAPSERGAVASTVMTADTLGSSIGMLAGGAAVARFSWRAVFLLPAVPMAFLWLLSLGLLIPRTAAQGGAELLRFDVRGASCFAGASLCLLLALNRGNDLGWSSPTVVGLTLASVLLFFALAREERFAENPVIPSWLFAGRVPVTLLLVLMSASSCYGSTLLLLPLFLQDGLGMGPGRISGLLVPRPLTAMLTSAAMTCALRRSGGGGTAERLSLARAGSLVLLAAYVVINVTARLEQGAAFFTLLELQICLQAAGHFVTTLSANALLVASVPAEQLANASAIQKVLSATATLLMTTLGVAASRAADGAEEPGSYRTPWLMALAVASLPAWLLWAVPAGAEGALPPAASPGAGRARAVPAQLLGKAPAPPEAAAQPAARPST